MATPLHTAQVEYEKLMTNRAPKKQIIAARNKFYLELDKYITERVNAVFAEQEKRERGF